MDGGLGLLTVQQVTRHMEAHRESGIWGLVISAVGVALIGYGLVLTVRMRRWRAHAAAARGRVIDQVSGSGDGRKTWMPIIQFEANGVTVTVDSPTSRSRRPWPIGHTVDVLYDPADPRRAGLAGSGPVISWMLPLGIVVVGAFLAVVTT